MKQGRKTETKAHKEARFAFYEGVLATSHLFRGGCWFSTIVPHKCDGPIDPCHIIDKQGLWVSGRKLKRPELMVYDVRNGLPGCRKIHGQFDRTSMPGIRIYQDELPDSIFMFITDWEDALEMPGHLHEKLNRKCPKGARP